MTQKRLRQRLLRLPLHLQTRFLARFEYRQLKRLIEYYDEVKFMYNVRTEYTYVSLPNLRTKVTSSFPGVSSS